MRSNSMLINDQGGNPLQKPINVTKQKSWRTNGMLLIKNQIIQL
jgi:hypothetical protein